MTFITDRRGVLRLGLAASALAVPWPAFAALSKSTIPAAPFVEVETVNGRVRGGTARGALSFKGIPYAGPLSGEGRFRAPPPVNPWTGVFDATKLGPPAIQKPNATYGEQEPAKSEDCAVLNVWTPAADGKKRPVMVYLHGGGFAHGSGGSPVQDGGRLAAVYDVVVVACNHRLGLMGYLWLGEGYDANAGMLDIVASLKWVRDNIAAFGGDPGNVTVFGESGGGAKVATLLAMPQARGLFHKAGIESGAWMHRVSAAEARETALKVMKALDISDVRRLHEVPVETLLDLQEKTPGIGTFEPVVDGHVLPMVPFDPKAPETAADIPLLIGWNRDEATFFHMGNPQVFSLTVEQLKARLKAEFGDRADEILDVYDRLYPNRLLEGEARQVHQASIVRLGGRPPMPADLYIAIQTAKAFGNDSITLASRKSEQVPPVYLYRYDYPSNRPIDGVNETLRAGHATDIGPTFLNWDVPGLHGDGPGLEEASLSLSSAFVSFARTGKPSGAGLPDWPRYDRDRRATMLISRECRIEDDPDGPARKMWGAG